ncbi:MAG: V-type ATP synthase subunit E family protein [Candidatus Margulisiibacteriota bacterium]
MGLAEIEKRILFEAEAEAHRIKKSAEELAEEIKAKGRLQAEELRQQILGEFQKKAEEEKKAIVIPAKLWAKKRILQEKHHILDEVFAKVPKEIREEKEIEVAKILYG